MNVISRSQELKQALVNFVLDAEGDLAEGLEIYAVAQSCSGQQDGVYQDLIVDSFICEGKVGEQTPIDLFLADCPNLSESDRDLVRSWRNSFTGLFAVTQVTDEFILMNWLTAKHYIVKLNDAKTSEEITKFREGEILLTRIAPINDTCWMFFGPYIPMGKLGKPKLAVAIGNFKENYKNALYRDAPELLEQAWLSVEQYHNEFVEFFGSDEVTMPGYQLNKKIAEFQAVMTQRRLATAGIDPNKSLAEVIQEAGIGEEIQAAVAEVGADSSTISQIVDKSTTKMVAPKIDLPTELKKAEQVTTLTHPRWGQIFLPTYTQFKLLLEAEDWQKIEGAEKLVRYYLDNSTINPFIWQRLAQQYPVQLEKVLQTVLARPQFQLNRDLNQLLQEFNKPTEPELPEIAAVPQHLHDLFEAAVAEINKSKSKTKSNKKTGMGFQS